MYIAKKQADELNKTNHQLESFDLKITLTTEDD